MIDTPEVIVHPNGCLNRRNAAKYLGLTAGTLSRWASEGTGPKFIKRGRAWYRKEDLDAWLDAGEVTSAAQARARGAR
ncbi:DNA-binding protein [Pigmentiphaga sp. H8]|uniref:helix-turn-helix transcriptional regulator n=1 Tax=Pigmentiphaga sp. H8 TaxID=2488560 RepID=UPI000F5AFB4E|nr:DNA-binding protein [Pigmentiphaga sp. H8]